MTSQPEVPTNPCKLVASGPPHLGRPEAAYDEEGREIAIVCEFCRDAMLAEYESERALLEPDVPDETDVEPPIEYVRPDPPATESETLSLEDYEAPASEDVGDRRPLTEPEAEQGAAERSSSGSVAPDLEPDSGFDQAALFDLRPWWEEHWQGMPEYSHEDLTPNYSLIVHFATFEAVQQFAALVDQTITKKTRSLWYPEAEIGHFANKRYSDAAREAGEG